MAESILKSTKKALGIATDYEEFDPDIIMFINSAFSTLNQLGLGPINGFMIESETTTWDAFLRGDMRLNSAKTWVYLKVRLLFDPPAVASVATAMQAQVEELQWRLNVAVEGGSYTGTVQPDDSVFDGGNARGEMVTNTVFDGGGA